jgi:hypothetical protein
MMGPMGELFRGESDRGESRVPLRGRTCCAVSIDNARSGALLFFRMDSDEIDSSADCFTERPNVR